MEIERKWMVSGWPAGLVCGTEFAMRQGYVSVRPTVRIREETPQNGPAAWILCFKSAGGLAREEIETPISRALFEDIAQKIIARPLIPKTRRDYPLPGGRTLEVSQVDAGAPTAFWYAEIEFDTVEAANAFDPASVGLADYLCDEVTGQPGQSMGEYWEATRGRNA